MPEEGMQWLKRESILSFDEIERVARIAVDLGIKEIRLTGGEPTLRPNLPELVARLSRLPLRSLSLTTNGFLLRSMARPLAEAGLKRINVSLDTLQHDRFHQIARRRGLDEVLAGLEELERYPTIAPIKVNVVAMRDFTEDEVVAFAKLARRKPYVIRFIEFMPLDADGNWQREQVLTGNEIKAIIERDFMPMRPLETEPSSTSRSFTFADGVGELGFINPVSQPFCGTCNRIRLTADGQLRTCLFSIDEWDLRGPLRAGASDDAVAQAMIDAVAHKELKHKINEGAAFQRASRSMSQIGG
jgi:cyclic pyranopterin phosphate synthase